MTAVLVLGFQDSSITPLENWKGNILSRNCYHQFCQPVAQQKQMLREDYQVPHLIQGQNLSWICRPPDVTPSTDSLD